MIKNCKYCQKEFNTNNRCTVFCSVSCSRKAIIAGLHVKPEKKQSEEDRQKKSIAMKEYCATGKRKDRTKICPNCQQEFIAKDLRTECCSYSCSQKHKPRTTWRKGMQSFMLGKPVPIERREKLRETYYQGNPPPVRSKTIRRLIMQQKFYHEWRKSVFERDSCSCQRCGAKEGLLDAHHIIPMKEIIGLHQINSVKDIMNEKFPLLEDVNNGITLCRKCHIEEHKLLRKKAI